MEKILKLGHDKVVKESREKSTSSIRKSPTRSIGESPVKARRSKDAPRTPSSEIFEKKVKEITGNSLEKGEAASPSPTKVVDKISSKPSKIPGTVPPPNAGRKVVKKVRRVSHVRGHLTQFI